MAQNIHDLGDLVRVEAEFRNALTGAALDPTAVFLSVREPDGTVTTYTYGGAEITQDSTGIYHALIDVDQAGVWRYRWWSTGSGQAAEEKVFKVRQAHAVEDT